MKNNDLIVSSGEDAEIISNFKTRLSKMQSARTTHEKIWQDSEKQIATPTGYHQGELMVNVWLEQNCLEMYLGRRSGKTHLECEPIGTPDADEIQVARYTLEYYMDLGEYYDHKKLRKTQKATYGTSIWYTGITYECSRTFENIGSEDGNGRKKIKYKEGKKEKYIVTPRNIPIRQFYMDDQAVSRGFKFARDCIYTELLTIDQYDEKYGHNEYYKKIENLSVMLGSDQNLTTQDNQTNTLIYVYHYYNLNNKDYNIIVNQEHLIYSEKMTYKHNKLPFVVTQHYPNPLSAYGIGIPRKLYYIKSYKNEMLQYLLRKVINSSGTQVLVGNDASVDEEFLSDSGRVNLRRTSGDVSQIQQMTIDGNIAQFLQVMNMIDDLVIQDTGENIKAPYTSPAKTAYEAGLMKEDTVTRLKSIDEGEDLGEQEALSMSLCNIEQYASKLLKTTVIESGMEVTKFPTLQIKNVSIEQYDDGLIFKEDHGKYGVYEFGDDMIMGEYRVRITNPSYGTNSRILNQDKMTRYMGVMLQMAQANPEIIQQINWQGIIEMAQQDFGYDDKMMPQSKKKEIENKNKELSQEFINLLQTNETDNGQNIGMNAGSDQQAQGGQGGPVAQNQGASIGA